MNQIKVLALGAHPDDVEFGCAGTLLLLKEQGFDVKIVDLTRGENARRGADQRLKEARAAAKLLGMKRQTLNLGDGKLDASNQRQTTTVADLIKKIEPQIIFAPYFVDLHPDHAAVGKMLRNYPDVIHYYLPHVGRANIGVDISAVYKQKYQAIMAHQSQIKNGDLAWIKERNASSGKKIGAQWGEIFYSKIELVRLPRLFKQVVN